MSATGGGCRRLLKFQFVGTMGAAVQLGVLGLLTSGLGVQALVSTAIAVETAVIHNFAWHERWTWADRTSNRDAPGRLKRFLQFNASTGLLSIGFNVILTYFAIDVMGAPYLLANMFAIAAASLFNFLVSDLDRVSTAGLQQRDSLTGVFLDAPFYKFNLV